MTNTYTAVKVEDVTKCYRIYKKNNNTKDIPRKILSFLKSPLNNYRKYRSLYKFDDINLENVDKTDGHSSDIIFALKNVSLEVKQGEVVGIIGRNGAGKSTLLKILSRITRPTIGRVEVRGRISSLLEVGTGFHEELTGRENVYLNGTILGMTKKEVDQRFEEIVDFSGVEKFIDTPVKRYSSGMKVRLAFSVAAHLEPELLLVDEVLAVGDAAFQKKCIGKMGSVAQAGRTVLFVSHNMAAISQLCERAIWLDGGQVELIGPASEVISSYLSSASSGEASWHSSDDPKADTEVQLKSVRILSQDHQPTSIIAFNDSFKVEITYDVLNPIRDLSVTYLLFNSEGYLVLESMDTDMPEWKGRTREPGRYVAMCKVPAHLLKPGEYSVSTVSFIEYVKIIERQEAVLTFDVSEVGYCLNPGRLGVVSPVFEWEVTRTDIHELT